MRQALMAQYVLFYCRDEVATWEILPTTKITLLEKIIVKESWRDLSNTGVIFALYLVQASAFHASKSMLWRDSHVTIFLGVNWS